MKQPPQNYNGQIGPCPFVSTPFNKPSIVIPSDLGGETRRMLCPHCQADISTEVTYHTGRLAHLVALFLCVFGCCCCLCVPYCVNSCKDADHSCPHCKHHIGFHRR